MAFLTSMNISASGLTAQRKRLDIISENITNYNTTRTEDGGPYTRKAVVFQSTSDNSFRSQFSSSYDKQTPGVMISEVVEDPAPYKIVFKPEHPDADVNGYVALPNVDITQETIDSMETSRAYEANVTAFNAIKAMAAKALEIGR